MMIVDCHTHIGNGKHIQASAKQLLESMDGAGVEKSIVFAGRFSETHNQNLLKAIESHKDRLYGVASISIHDTEYYRDELFDLIKTKKVVGVKFYTGYEHYYPSDKIMMPLLNKLSELGLPAIFHCGDTLNTIEGAKLKFSHPLQIDDVAVEFPDLKIVIAHMGFPWIIDAAAVCLKNKNVYADISGGTYGEFSLREAAHFRKCIKQFIKIVGNKDKLLFGSDWPICNQYSYVSEFLDDIISPRISYLNRANYTKVFKL